MSAREPREPPARPGKWAWLGVIALVVVLVALLFAFFATGLRRTGARREEVTLMRPLWTVRTYRWGPLRVRRGPLGGRCWSLRLGPWSLHGRTRARGHRSVRWS
ncbi:hypothetical protein [Saccharopolyspora rosea]|uniref:Uncharacterized protein n=1 Tax=Saccharopolyspora rosea TaxID=524884 RepID=A0ABW3FZZ8_9PSEU|nr:hypothetical protein [Saccharopolyspora rosea]